MTRPIRAASLLLVLALLSAGTLPAGADPLADKRAEAERLSRDLEEQGRRISILAEEVNNARLRADRAGAEAASARSHVAAAERSVTEAQERLRFQAVEAYVRGGRLPIAQAMLSARTEDIAIRQEYVRAVLSREKDALTALREAEEQRRAQQAAAEQAQRAAQDALGRVEATRRDAAEAEARQRATLGKVRGELAAMVEAERRRREEEAARRAREELARRQAAEAARRRAQEQRPRARGSTPTDDGGGGGGGDNSGPAPSPARGASAAVAEAKRQIGKPYQWGAAGPDSFDCSGLTQWSWRVGGRSLPHSSQAQYGATTRVSISQLEPGDLVFYGSPIHHVGIYVGNGQMVEASQTGTPVRYASIFRRDFAGAGRVT